MLAQVTALLPGGLAQLDIGSAGVSLVSQQDVVSSNPRAAADPVRRAPRR